jgi:hypothetical protein
MDSRSFAPLALVGAAFLLLGCEKQTPPTQTAVQQPTAGIIPGVAGKPMPGGAASVQMTAVKCPVQEEIYAFRIKVRQAYNNKRFDELESIASDLRKNKALFGNGSWKTAQFYSAFECRSDEPESMWKLHDSIHRDWVATKKNSVTAMVALADFLVDYAWRARGNDFADTVTEEGWRLFRERLAAARDVLREASVLPEKDPNWGLVTLRVARGQEWKPSDVDTLVEEITAAEPKFWGYHTERAFALLPRWFGNPGDWERYAEKVAARPDGLGDELYARIVIHLRGYHENIFKESKASWQKTKAGLRIMLQKYPQSLEIPSSAALLAGTAQDRPFAKEMFEKLGGRYVASAWRKPERFTHVKHWADTGVW